MAGRQTRELDSDLHILEQRILPHIGRGMDNTLDVVSNIAEYCDEDDKLKEDTRKIMADLVRMEGEVKNFVSTLNHVKASPLSHEGASLLSTFENKMFEIMSKGKVDVTKHPKYTAMMEEYENAGNIDEQLESLRTQLVGQTEDEDVALTQAEVNIKCPYTGQNMVDPVRNTHCRHVYDRDGIMGHIQHKKQRAKCPVGGCVNPQFLHVSHLEEHRDLKRYITLLNKKNQ